MARKINPRGYRVQTIRADMWVTVAGPGAWHEAHLGYRQLNLMDPGKYRLVREVSDPKAGDGIAVWLEEVRDGEVA